jgi:protein-tyrosine-phosphatase
MKILVLSEHDDCCGPMAAAFLRDYSEKWEIVSAGKAPTACCPWLVITTMRECLIDLSGYQPRSVSDLDLSAFDAVYECFDSPCPQDLDACRVLRDRIKNDAFLFYKQSLSSIRLLSKA